VFARALVGFDGSPSSQRALERGLQLATEHGCKLTVVTVEAHLPHYAATVGEMDEERRREEQQAHRVLTEASALAAERGVTIHSTVRIGHAAQEILRAAAEAEAEVILLGHSGHSGVWGRFLGSTAEKVSRHASCSVLLVR
jgi:nucleotide-binding universal stress UspA family protein